MHLTTTGIQPVGTIGDGRLDLDALNRMQSLGMVIKESMRLLAPVPALPQLRDYRGWESKVLNMAWINIARSLAYANTLTWPSYLLPIAQSDYLTTDFAT